jgi:hypothetical protein
LPTDLRAAEDENQKPAKQANGVFALHISTSSVLCAPEQLGSFRRVNGR